MSCSSCGTVLPAGARFCLHCGARVDARGHSGTAVASPPREAPAIPAEELHAAVAARRELGERLESEVVESFLTRVGHAIDARVDERLSGRLSPPRPARPRAHDFSGRVAASLALGIPITAIAGGIGGLIGVVGALAAIVGLNVYYTEVEKEITLKKRD
jgi:hypothetical protein